MALTSHRRRSGPEGSRDQHHGGSGDRGGDGVAGGKRPPRGLDQAGRRTRSLDHSLDHPDGDLRDGHRQDEGAQLRPASARASHTTTPARNGMVTVAPPGHVEGTGQPRQRSEAAAVHQVEPSVVDRLHGRPHAVHRHEHHEEEGGQGGPQGQADGTPMVEQHQGSSRVRDRHGCPPAARARGRARPSTGRPGRARCPRSRAKSNS